MRSTSSNSIYGDAEVRRRRTLDAAIALLDEGGYSALTLRAVAKRAGTSTGLIYQYFLDKQDIFAALLSESQLEMADFVNSLPREQGLTALLAAMIPEFARHWARVGRLVTTWRDIEGMAGSERESMLDLHASVSIYNAALIRALAESAAAEGSTLLDDPALIHVVLSGLKGLSDTIVNDFAKELTPGHLVNFSARALARAITA
ncbi:TetR/AcrR family transcriptional regulator [Rhodococcus sp. IEGM 1379]|uniref:TetR/AcrR family transcriptional regulator n=1 Tax=Rhodococcus sp. IEGM 1379 TaxID=3047086 RepID=UPI0024B66879|nr:TetR/AcrR family transcriptional regulator [Rhodococcus sp. IEGM 1379]MDI9917272.1 helix-turn-helix domain-containing protein [Rhodococcus sp. IEGM 1379]